MKYKKYTIESIRELINHRSISLISQTYTRTDLKYDWKCDICDHKWKTTLHGIKQGRGCPYCAGRAYTIDDMHKLANKRGFKFVSSVFTRIIDKHEWECRDGHVWSATPNSLKAKESNCPYCNTPLTEEKCRFIFESLTGYKFPKTRQHLKNKQELDGYCDKLQIAFEYQGQQHFKTMYYHTAERGLQEQKLRDQKKRKICKEQGTTLIEVPYQVAKTDEELEIFIRAQLIHLGYEISKTELDWNQFKGKPSEMEKIKLIAKELNIECLSNIYRGDKGEINLKCLVCNYKWVSRAGYIMLRRKCPRCTHRLRLTIEEVRKICSDRKIAFLSNKYTRIHAKYSYQCKRCEHIWTAGFNHIRRGSGCPRCGIYKNKTHAPSCYFQAWETKRKTA